MYLHKIFKVKMLLLKFVLSILLKDTDTHKQEKKITIYIIYTHIAFSEVCCIVLTDSHLNFPHFKSKLISYCGDNTTHLSTYLHFILSLTVFLYQQLFPPLLKTWCIFWFHLFFPLLQIDVTDRDPFLSVWHHYI